MSDQVDSSQPVGSAVIEAVFVVSGRGRVLAFLQPFQGIAPHDGIVRTSQGDMPYSWVEHVLRTDKLPSRAVIVPDTPASKLIQPGEPISFLHKP